VAFGGAGLLAIHCSRTAVDLAAVTPAPSDPAPPRPSNPTLASLPPPPVHPAQVRPLIQQAVRLRDQVHAVRRRRQGAGRLPRSPHSDVPLRQGDGRLPASAGQHEDVGQDETALRLHLLLYVTYTIDHARRPLQKKTIPVQCVDVPRACKPFLTHCTLLRNTEFLHALLPAFLCCTIVPLYISLIWPTVLCLWFSCLPLVLMAVARTYPPPPLKHFPPAIKPEMVFVAPGYVIH
jgi:hypothetical protein